MTTETPLQRSARIAKRVKDQNGACYVLVVVVNGKIADPWAFTEYIDAQTKQAELEVAAEDEHLPNVTTQVFRVNITPPGMEPPRPKPATER